MSLFGNWWKAWTKDGIAEALAESAMKSISSMHVDTAMKSFAESPVLVYPGNVAGSGTHIGKERVRKFFETLYANFVCIRFDVLEVGTGICNANGAIVVFICANVVTINKNGFRMENHGVSKIAIKDGKVVSLKDFFFSDEDLKNGWEGVPGASDRVGDRHV